MAQDASNLPLSANAVTGQAPTEAVEGACDTEMYEAATLLGSDNETSDVDFAFEAQAEVVTANV